MSAVVRGKWLKTELLILITARPGTEVSTKPALKPSRKIWPQSIKLAAINGDLRSITVEGLAYTANGAVGSRMFMVSWNWPREVDKIPAWIQEIVRGECHVLGLNAAVSS